MTTAQQTSDALTAAVRAQMKKAGVSQRSLADTAGIPLVTLNRRLRGAPFTVLELARIAEVLDTTVLTLVAAAQQTPLAATA